MRVAEPLDLRDAPAPRAQVALSISPIRIAVAWIVLDQQDPVVPAGLRAVVPDNQNPRLEIPK